MCCYQYSNLLTAHFSFLFPKSATIRLPKQPLQSGIICRDWLDKAPDYYTSTSDRLVELCTLKVYNIQLAKYPLPLLTFTS